VLFRSGLQLKRHEVRAVRYKYGRMSLGGRPFAPWILSGHKSPSWSVEC